MADLTNENLLERLRSTSSPIDKTLGLRFQRVDLQAGTCELSFEIGKEFTNPMGVVFGGIQSAMLDAALSIAGSIKSGLQQGMVSLEIKTSFLRSAAPGCFGAKGKTIRLGRNVAFLESELFDLDGNLIAKASGTALPVSL